MHDQLVSLSDAARMLAISRNTTAWLVKNGTLKACRLQPAARRKGRKLYVRRGDVERLKNDAWRRIAPRKQRTSDRAAEEVR